MTRTMVYLPDNLHKAIKYLAVERHTSMAKLVQEALESLYQEDIEDLKVGRERLVGFLEHPSKASSYSEYRAKRPKKQVAGKYQTFLEPRAERELDKISRPEFSKIDKAILSLGSNPRPFGVKKLDDKLHRIRVGHWRIIYAIFDEESKLVILRVVRCNERTYK